MLSFVIVRTVVIPQQLGEILGPSPAAGIENATEVKASSWPDSSVKDYSVIIEQNIFSGADSPRRQNKALSGDENEGLVQSAEDELGLTLLGTVSGSPAVSRAVIKDIESDTIELYEIGDVVATASIESIETDAVILLHEGKRKILRLNRSQSVGNNNNARSPLYQTTNQKSEMVDTNLPIKQAHTKLHTKIGYVEAILKGAIIEPHVVNGQTEGLKITGLENIPAAKKFGLKNGDIIREVNGQQLTDKQKAFQVFKKAKTQPTMNIELLRDGEMKELSFDFQ